MSAASNRMTSALETHRELRRRLTDDVSHELNTPLGVIRLDVSGLRDGLQTAESAPDQSRRRGIGGTGLGLAITRAIIEAHGEPLH